MNEQDIRGLVREAIERHLARPEEKISRPRLGSHPSHILLEVAAGSEIDDGMCVIEPAVRCNHCGFCKSYGH